MRNSGVLAPFIKPVGIIGVACAAGAPDAGCAAGPDALRAGGLVSHLGAGGLPIAWKETIRARCTGGDEPARVVQRVTQRLAQRVRSLAALDRLPVILGGDHSCAIGTWQGAAAALRARGPFGLLWIDAHMDAHTCETTPSGALHGMPLACLLGHGDARLTGPAGAAALRPEHVCLIGVRSFEAGEEALLRRLGVRVYYMGEIARRGLAAVMGEALDIVTAGTAGFGITVDLDAIDPADAPGVTTPAADGLRSGDLIAALDSIADHPGLTAVEVVEYNPERDVHGRTAATVVQLLDAVLAGVLRSAASASLQSGLRAA
jgi:arginase